MHNLLKFFNGFKDLSSQVDESIEMRTTMSALGLADERLCGDIEITLKYKPEIGIRNGTPIVFFFASKYQKMTKHFYLGLIDIPSGNIIHKKSFTAKKIHVKRGSVIRLIPVSGGAFTAEWRKNVMELFTTTDDRYIYVRALTPSETADYYDILSEASEGGV